MKSGETKRTVEAVRAELDGDPEYQKLRKKLDEEHARRGEAAARAEKPVLAALHKIGFDIASLNDLLDEDLKLGPQVVGVLIDRLPKITEKGILETVIRGLIGAEDAFDGERLIRLFEDTNDNEGIRWTIAFTMTRSPVTGISDWVVKTVNNPSYGIAREPLIRALPKLTSREKAIPALLGVLGEIPGHAAYALGRIGGLTEVEFLQREQRKKHAHKWIDLEIAKAIEKTRKRSERRRPNVS